MQTRTNRSKLFKDSLLRLKELRQDIENAGEICRFDREMARYDSVAIVESLPVTLKEKADLACIPERKYHYARRVVREYPDRNDFFNYLKEHPRASVYNFKTKKAPTTDSVVRAVSATVRKFDMDYTNPDVIKAVLVLYNKMLNENILDNNHLNRNDYLRNQPCVACGEPICGNKTWDSDGFSYPICDDCHEAGVVPRETSLRKCLVAYSENLYNSYIKLLEIV